MRKELWRLSISILEFVINNQKVSSKKLNINVILKFKLHNSSADNPILECRARACDLSGEQGRLHFTKVCLVETARLANGEPKP